MYRVIHTSIYNCPRAAIPAVCARAPHFHRTHIPAAHAVVKTSKEGRGLRLTQRLLLAGGEVEDEDEDEDEVGERSVSVSTPYSY